MGVSGSSQCSGVEEEIEEWGGAFPRLLKPDPTGDPASSMYS